MEIGAVLLAMAIVAAIVAVNYKTLKKRGKRRFSKDSMNYRPEADEKLHLFPQRSPKKQGLYSVPKPSGLKSVSPQGKQFENKHCELCNGTPLVQFKDNTKGFTLEFCSHHAASKESVLLEGGFVISKDLRNR